MSRVLPSLSCYSQHEAPWFQAICGAKADPRSSQKSESESSEDNLRPTGAKGLPPCSGHPFFYMDREDIKLCETEDV